MVLIEIRKEKKKKKKKSGTGYVAGQLIDAFRRSVLAPLVTSTPN
jgi:hypothetical protein